MVETDHSIEDVSSLEHASRNLSVPRNKESRTTVSKFFVPPIQQEIKEARKTVKFTEADNTPDDRSMQPSA